MNFFEVDVNGNIVKFSDGNKITIPEGIVKKLDGKKVEKCIWELEGKILNLIT